VLEAPERFADCILLIWRLALSGGKNTSGSIIIARDLGYGCFGVEVHNSVRVGLWLWNILRTWNTWH